MSKYTFLVQNPDGSGNYGTIETEGLNEETAGIRAFGMAKKEFNNNRLRVITAEKFAEEQKAKATPAKQPELEIDSFTVAEVELAPAEAPADGEAAPEEVEAV